MYKCLSDLPVNGEQGKIYIVGDRKYIFKNGVYKLYKDEIKPTNKLIKIKKDKTKEVKENISDNETITKDDDIKSNNEEKFSKYSRN